MTIADCKDDIKARYISGQTSAEIANVYSCKADSICKILRKNGVKRKDGGQFKGLTLREKIEADCDKRFMEKLGCVFSVYKEIVRVHGRWPRRAFTCQRRMARIRGIAWEMSFIDWWNIWQESGHWEQRGKHGDEYVMGRLGDDGPYKVGNVEIISMVQNIRDGVKNAKANGRHRANIGRGKGWVKIKRCRSRPYIAIFRHKIIGYYATPEEASAAYQVSSKEFLNSKS